MYNSLLLPKMLFTATAAIGLVVGYQYFYDGTEYVKSNIDEKKYRVRSGNDKQHKADLLAIINLKLNIIVDTLSKDSLYYSNTPVQRLVYNWGRGVSIKEIGKMETDAAYVINKQDMSFCLQEKPEENNKTVHDINLMTYVAIHELAHIMSNEIGHGDEFIGNFEFLLNYCKKLKFVDPFTNKETPLYIQLDQVADTADNYCGVALVNSIN